MGNLNESFVVRVTGLGGEVLDEAMLLSWAKVSLRSFPWPEEFDDDLLERSPRDVEENRRGATFALSRQHNVAARTKISYFLSHSWDEGAEGRRAKVTALKNFFGKSGGINSLWFDKVCMNKMDVNNRAITVLPITVGSCKKMLVLLSPSYLKRLWCVWELQAVFAFCIKELAMDRIVVVDAGGGAALQRDALAWSLDDSHCFDPNEELRLRRLASVLGIERFVGRVCSLAACASLASVRA